MILSVGSCLLFIVNPLIVLSSSSLPIIPIVLNLLFLFWVARSCHLFVFLKQKLIFEKVLCDCPCVCLFLMRVCSRFTGIWNWTIGSFRFSFYCKCVTIYYNKKGTKRWYISLSFFFFIKHVLSPGHFPLQRRDFFDFSSSFFLFRISKCGGAW